MVSTQMREFARARALSASPCLLRVSGATRTIGSSRSSRLFRFRMEVGGGQPHWPPRPDASPHPRRGSSPRTRPLRPLPRSSASPGPQTPRAYPERRRAAHARPSEIRAERFSWTRSKGGRPRRPPRTETRGARDRRPRRHRRPRWPSRRATTMSPRALPEPSGCSTRGGNWRRCGWSPMEYTKSFCSFFVSVASLALLLPRAGGPSDLRAAPAPGEAPNRLLCCSPSRSGRRSSAFAEDQSGGGERGETWSRGRARRRT